MKLAELTWKDVAELDRDVLVVIPTGSLEQHGPHLPLFTDSILVTAVAEAVEARMADKVLLTPTLWLGASAHHMQFDGTVTASFAGYQESLHQVVNSLQQHGFWKFFVINGHGGNNSSNDISIRQLKEASPEILIGTSGYYQFIPDESAKIMTGPLRTIRHACEAEASLMMHVRPDLVRVDKRRDDGLSADVVGMCHTFDEITEEGSYGFATLGTAEKGKALFDAAVDAIVANFGKIVEGYSLNSIV